MDEHKKLTDMIQDFDTAMLVTHHPQHGVDARPMAIADVTLQGGNKFVSLSGKLQTTEDRAKVRELWQESWNVWFPKGVDDPSIVLLNLKPERGEYWDNSGFQGAKYLLKAGKAYLQGSTPNSTKDEHSRVSM